MNDSSVLTGSFMEPPTSKGLKGFHLVRQVLFPKQINLKHMSKNGLFQRKRKRKISDFLSSNNGSPIPSLNGSCSNFDVSG